MKNSNALPFTLYSIGVGGFASVFVYLPFCMLVYGTFSKEQALYQVAVLAVAWFSMVSFFFLFSASIFQRLEVAVKIDGIFYLATVVFDTKTGRCSAPPSAKERVLRKMPQDRADDPEIIRGAPLYKKNTQGGYLEMLGHKFFFE